MPRCGNSSGSADRSGAGRLSAIGQAKVDPRPVDCSIDRNRRLAG